MCAIVTGMEATKWIAQGTDGDGNAIAVIFQTASNDRQSDEVWIAACAVCSPDNGIDTYSKELLTELRESGVKIWEA